MNMSLNKLAALSVATASHMPVPTLSVPTPEQEHLIYNLPAAH